MVARCCYSFFFFFNDTATTEIYTLSLHDALPISTAGGTTKTAAPCAGCSCWPAPTSGRTRATLPSRCTSGRSPRRSEEHTSELQSQSNLVCRLLLEKKKRTPYFRQWQ